MLGGRGFLQHFSTLGQNIQGQTQRYNEVMKTEP